MHRSRSLSRRFFLAIFMLTAVIGVRTDAQTAPPDVPIVQVSTRADAVRPGDVVMLAVRCECVATSGSAESPLLDRTVRLFRDTDTLWRILVGIDVETKPHSYPVTVTLNRPDGPPASATYSIRVVARQFPVRRLTVAPDFVNPPAEVQGRITGEAERLRTIFASSTTRRSLGAFEAPASTSVTSNFGERSVFNGQPRSPHAGVDFRGPVGSAIAAPGDGTVVLASDLYFTGRTVVIDHGWGLHSILAHLSDIAVTPGSEVKRGDVVGALGATGRVTGPRPPLGRTAQRCPRGSVVRAAPPGWRASRAATVALTPSVHLI